MSNISDSEEQSSSSDSNSKEADTLVILFEDPTASDAERVNNKPLRFRLLLSLTACFVNIFVDHCDAGDKEKVKKELCYLLDDYNLVPKQFFEKEINEIREYFSPVIYNALQSYGFQHKQQLPYPVLFNRYISDFHEGEKLGEGGFGEVYIVKSKLDCQLYAMKKVILASSSDKEISKSLEEVRTLAMLHHPNVVRYHYSWLEKSKPDFYVLEKETEMPETCKAGNEDISQKIDDISFSEGDSTRSSQIHSWNPKRFHHPSHIRRFIINDDSQEAETTESHFKNSEPRENSQRNALCSNLILHIQMELCSTNLKQYLENRKEIEECFIFDFWKQMFQALEYVHGCNLVHCDIKPANIFMKENADQIVFLLGDFGLAFQHNNSQSKKNSEDAGGGTPPYSAPELENSLKPGPMVDVYSFGIVLFEICNLFSTGTERAICIHNLKIERKVPQEMRDFFPKMTAQVLEMTEPNVKKRLPTYGGKFIGKRMSSSRWTDKANARCKKETLSSETMRTDNRVLYLFFASLVEKICNEVETTTGPRQGLYSKLEEMKFLPSVFFSQSLESSRSYLSTMVDTAIELEFKLAYLFDRSNADFVNIETLYDEGHSICYKVESRIDKREYSVRKIKRKCISFHDLVFVQVLTTVWHKNVPRYFFCWLERENPDIQSIIEKHVTPFPYSEIHAIDDNYSICEETSNANVEFAPIRMPENELELTFNVTRLLINNFPPEEKNTASLISLNTQMEVCAMNLSQYLRQRREIDHKFNVNLMSQMLTLCDYLHSKKISVRQIMPDHIYIKEKDGETVFLLDILVRVLITKTEENLIYCPDDKTLQNWVSSPIGNAEMYSLGIIFFELYNIFESPEVRLQEIAKMKVNRKVPDELTKNFGFIGHFILCVTDKLSMLTASKALWHLERETKLETANNVNTETLEF